MDEGRSDLLEVRKSFGRIRGESEVEVEVAVVQVEEVQLDVCLAVRPVREVVVETGHQQDGTLAGLRQAEKVGCLVVALQLHAVACRFPGSYLGDSA